MPPGVLLEGWPTLGFVVLFIILPGVVAGAAGGGLAFARAKERLWQRLVLGALTGPLTCGFLLRHLVTLQSTVTFRVFAFVFSCIVGGYAGADGISILLKAIGRGK